MVNFENLVVEELLFEQEAKPAAGATQQAVNNQQAVGNNQNQQATRENWEMFFNTNKNDLKSVYDTKFTNIGISFPEDSTTTTLIQAVHNHASRDSGLNAVGKENVKRYFPIVDLLARLYDKSVEDKEANKNPNSDFKQVLDQFKKDLNQFRGIPSDFPPKSMMGKRLIDQFNKSLPDLGTITLDKEPYPTNSIWFAVMTLLAARKKYRSNKIDLTKVPSSEKYVEDLIINFEKYAGGTNLVPRQFQSLYGDNITPQELVNIGKLANDYMEREAERLFFDYELDKSKKKQALLAFIKNAPLVKESLDFHSLFQKIFLGELFTTPDQAKNEIDKEMGDVSSETSSTDTTSETPKVTTFDWTPYIVKKEDVTSSDKKQENDQITPENTDNSADQQKNQNESINYFDKMYQKLILNEEEPIIEPTANEVNETPKPLDGGYILKNIKEQPSQENSKAKPLYDALLKLANYIRSQKQRDITGAINSAAGAMRSLASAGGPTMR